jgi:polyphenol oxidase
MEMNEEDAFVMRERVVDSTDGTARVEYLVCAPLEAAGFLNAFSTRKGGVSPLPANALNLAPFKGDSSDNVVENRRRFLSAIGSGPATLVTARQTHSTERVSIALSEQAPGAPPDCDAMTSRANGILLAIQTADCLPILIGDPRTGSMAAIHAGWRGTAGRIAERTVADLMQQGFDARHAIAALGPAACGDCYEVGQDVIERYKKEFRYWRDLLSDANDDGKAYLDIHAANTQQLLFCGFTEDRIHVAPYCTMHDSDLFFSYRREGRDQPSGTGRLLSVIGKTSGLEV